MYFFWWRLIDVAVLLLVVAVQYVLAAWTLETRWCGRSPRRARLVRLAGWLACAWVLFAFASGVPRVVRYLPPWTWLSWFRGLALTWALASLGALVVAFLWRRLPRFDPERRKLLAAARAAMCAAPFAAAGFGTFVERNRFTLRELDIAIPGLPADLGGLRLVQLSDIHLSPFLTERDLARVVAMANETRAHIALVTGDLITVRRDPLEACLNLLARLRAEACILGCLGNHEIYAGAEDYAEREGRRRGIDFLRSARRGLRFGAASLNIAGVDYQRSGEPYLTGAGDLLRKGAVNILLSHNPDVFPTAAGLGFDLTLSGHTHGGQVAVEILDHQLNFIRFFTPYVYGLYRQGSSAVYVTRGLGTVGPPTRIGAPPEVTLIRLCAT